MLRLKFRDLFRGIVGLEFLKNGHKRGGFWTDANRRCMKDCGQFWVIPIGGKNARQAAHGVVTEGDHPAFLGANLHQEMTLAIFAHLPPPVLGVYFPDSMLGGDALSSVERKYLY